MEVSFNETWDTVCDNGWDMNDAQVVCRELGFGSAINAMVGAHYGPGSGTIWLNNVMCEGTETALKQCSHSGWQNECTHEQDAGIKCAAPNDKTPQFSCQIKDTQLSSEDLRKIRDDHTILPAMAIFECDEKPTCKSKSFSLIIKPM